MKNTENLIVKKKICTSTIQTAVNIFTFIYITYLYIMLYLYILCIIDHLSIEKSIDMCAHRKTYRHINIHIYVTKMIFSNSVCILLLKVAQSFPLRSISCNFFLLVESYMKSFYSCLILYPLHMPEFNHLFAVEHCVH